jgi:predicted PurR-regulated permease PerM
VLGALVAIPVAATAQIIIRDFWERRHERVEEEDEGGEPPPPAPPGEPSPEPA